MRVARMLFTSIRHRCHVWPLRQHTACRRSPGTLPECASRAKVRFVVSKCHRNGGSSLQNLLLVVIVPDLGGDKEIKVFSAR